jgi:hypothetical protein
MGMGIGEERSVDEWMNELDVAGSKGMVSICLFCFDLFYCIEVLFLD